MDPHDEGDVDDHEPQREEEPWEDEVGEEVGHLGECPWAVVFDSIGFFAYIEMMIFIIILLVGYVYAWKKDAFNWD